MTINSAIPEKDWQTAYDREKAHRDSQARMSAYFLPILLALTVGIIYTLQKIVRLLYGPSAPAQVGVGLILGVILLLIGVIAVFVFWIGTAFRLAKQFTAELYAIPENIDPLRVLRYRLFGCPLLPPPLNMLFKFATITAKDGRVDKSDEWPAWAGLKLGGPFALTVFDGCALYLEEGERFSRIVGPGGEKPFLDLSEKIKAVVDLRPKTRSGVIQAWTRDGIKLSVSVKLTCRVGNDGRTEPIDQNKRQVAPEDQLVFPYDPPNVRKAVERQAIWAACSPSPHQVVDWSDLAWEETRSIFTREIGGRQLNEVLIAEEKEQQIFSKTVLEEIRKKLGQITKEFGVYVTDLNVVKLDPPDLVNRQRVRNWGAEKEGVQAIIQGKTRAHEIRSREKARAEAQRDLILAIADGLERNKSRQFSEPLLLSLSGMLDTTLKNPLTRASMAKETLETLEKLQKMLDKPV